MSQGQAAASDVAPSPDGNVERQPETHWLVVSFKGISVSLSISSAQVDNSRIIVERVKVRR